MKLPRSLGGQELSALLRRHYGYQITRQSGSHLRLTTTVNGEHHITIPQAKPLRVGTLAGVLSDVATHLGVPRTDVEDRLFGGS